MKKYILLDYIMQRSNALPFMYREVLRKIIEEAPFIFVKDDDEI